MAKASKNFTYEKNQRVLVPGEPNGTAGTVQGRADHTDQEEQYRLVWIGQSGMMRDGWFTLTAIRQANQAAASEASEQ
jgi:hypothetical protein